MEWVTRVHAHSYLSNCTALGMETIKDIIEGRDKRVLCIVGPCSIHNVDSAKEYAEYALHSGAIFGF